MKRLNLFSKNRVVPQELNQRFVLVQDLNYLHQFVEVSCLYQVFQVDGGLFLLCLCLMRSAVVAAVSRLAKLKYRVENVEGVAQVRESIVLGYSCLGIWIRPAGDFNSISKDQKLELGDLFVVRGREFSIGQLRKVKSHSEFPICFLLKVRPRHSENLQQLNGRVKEFKQVVFKLLVVADKLVQFLEDLHVSGWRLNLVR